jgi:Ca2+/H+ antiporter, TMEM165/GDT1 family
VSLAVAVTSFALVLPAELPDKTALATLVLGSRYRSLPVFGGVAAAFALHAVLAVTAGSLLSLLPQRILAAAVAVLFLLGAALLLRGRPEADQATEPAQDTRVSSARAAGTGFAVVLVAEFGDLTQIVTASLAARYHDPLAVGLGSVLALWTVAALAIVGGRGLLRLIPLTVLTRAAAGVLAALAVLSLARAVRG